jgi:hypothetical protein
VCFRPGDVEKDQEGLIIMKVFGQNMAWLLKTRFALLFLFIAIIACGFGIWLITSPKSDAVLLRDDAGQIVHASCIVNSARKASLRNAGLVRNIFKALSDHAKITILTNDRLALIDPDNPFPGPVEILELPEDADFTIWPQDPFLVLTRKNGEPVILESAEFKRADDRLIAKKLSASLNCEYRQSALSFDGGDIVSGDRHIFIGEETIRNNADKLNRSEEDIVRQFEMELKRKILVLRPMPMPGGHIDMVVTPLGKDRILVGDTRWGARIARNTLKKNPDAVRRFERSCEEMFFDDPRISTLNVKGGKTLTRPKVVGQSASVAESSEKIAGQLDLLAEGLRRFGYTVERIPLLLPVQPHSNNHNRSKRDGPILNEYYPCLTYNNVLVEDNGRDKIVYLPQYGWADFDNAAKGVWMKLDYKIVPVTGLTVSAMYGGSLRCCVKVLARQ